VARVIRDLTHSNVDDLPKPCRACTFWEFRPADREFTLVAADQEFEKEAWASEVSLVHGSAGKVAYLDGRPVGYALCGTQEVFRGAEMFPLRISRDALFLATLRVAEEARGYGIGKALVHAVLKETKARGRRAIEAYGDREWQHEVCIMPAAFLEALGFKVKREHPRFPLFRLDLNSLAKLSRNVEAAVEAFLESVFTQPSGVPERAG
jgi:GNAT superfamily N-acetyltransferase